MTPVNKPILNAAGQVVGTATNACGVYRDLAYSVLDQESPAKVIQGPNDVTITETFSNYSGPGNAPPPLSLAVDLVNSPGGDVVDTVALFHLYPTCLSPNENVSMTQAFSLTYGGKMFPLSLTNGISMGNFDGTLKDDVNISHNWKSTNVRILTLLNRFKSIPRFPLAVIFLVLAIARGQTPLPGVLERTIPQPLTEKNTSPIYVAHEVLLWAGIPGGVVDCADGPLVKQITIREGTTVSDALTAALSGQHDCFWQEKEGVINLLPQSGAPPLLQTNVAFFTWRASESPGSAVYRLANMPEVLRRMSQLGLADGLHAEVYAEKPPRLGVTSAPPDSPAIFERRNIILLDLLNDVVRSYQRPAIWAYRETGRAGVRGVTLSAH